MLSCIQEWKLEIIKKGRVLSQLLLPLTQKHTPVIPSTQPSPRELHRQAHRQRVGEKGCMNNHTHVKQRILITNDLSQASRWEGASATGENLLNLHFSHRFKKKKKLLDF